MICKTAVPQMNNNHTYFRIHNYMKSRSPTVKTEQDYIHTDLQASVVREAELKACCHESYIRVTLSISPTIHAMS